MKLKKSKYINEMKIDGEYIAFNSLTNSILKLENKAEIENFYRILKLTSLEKDNEKQKILFDSGMIISDFLMEENIVQHSFNRTKFRTISTPYNLTLFPSYVCNAKCDFCYLKDKVFTSNYKGDVKNYFEKIKAHLKKKQEKFVKLAIMGGEPLLFLDEIIDFLDSLKHIDKVETSIITNGILLNKENVTKIVNSNKIDVIQVSFDGPSFIHNQIKNVDNGFESVVNGLKMLDKYGYTGQVAGRINISKANSMYLNELIESLTTITNLTESLKFYVYPAFINDISGAVEESYCTDKLEMYDILDNFYRLCSKLMLPYSKPQMTSLVRNCKYLNDYEYSISPSLKVYKCDHNVADSDKAIGYINDHNEIRLYDLHNKGRIEHFNVLSSQLIRDDKCYSCSWLPVCRGGCPLINNGKNDCKAEFRRKFEIYYRYNFIKGVKI